MAKYDFWILQGNVATVLWWGGQNYSSNSRQVSFSCCMPEIIKIIKMFNAAIQKNKKWLAFCDSVQLVL